MKDRNIEATASDFDHPILKLIFKLIQIKKQQQLFYILNGQSSTYRCQAFIYLRDTSLNSCFLDERRTKFYHLISYNLCRLLYHLLLLLCHTLKQTEIKKSFFFFLTNLCFSDNPRQEISWSILF